MLAAIKCVTKTKILTYEAIFYTIEAEGLDKKLPVEKNQNGFRFIKLIRLFVII